MDKQTIREMKRDLSQGSQPSALEPAKQRARAAAVALLERSVKFRHRRLAVLRLSVAVQTGADIPEACWAYCAKAAMDQRDPQLGEIWRLAIKAYRARQRSRVMGGRCTAQDCEDC